jgi:hypothetical protein
MNWTQKISIFGCAVLLAAVTAAPAQTGPAGPPSTSADQRDPNNPASETSLDLPTRTTAPGSYSPREATGLTREGSPSSSARTGSETTTGTPSTARMTPPNDRNQSMDIMLPSTNEVRDRSGAPATSAREATKPSPAQPSTPAADRGTDRDQGTPAMQTPESGQPQGAPAESTVQNHPGTTDTPETTPRERGQ